MYTVYNTIISYRVTELFELSLVDRNISNMLFKKMDE